MGFDFTLIAPLLPSHCGFSSVLRRGVSSLVKSRVFLSMIVQQPVVVLVLSQEGVRARPSTPPSWLILPRTLFIDTIYFPPLKMCDYFINSKCLYFFFFNFLNKILHTYRKFIKHKFITTESSQANPCVTLTQINVFILQTTAFGCPANHCRLSSSKR